MPPVHLHYADDVMPLDSPERSCLQFTVMHPDNYHTSDHEIVLKTLQCQTKDFRDILEEFVLAIYMMHGAEK